MPIMCISRGKGKSTDIRSYLEYTEEIHWRSLCLILAQNDIGKAREYYEEWDIIDLYEWYVITAIANYKG